MAELLAEEKGITSGKRCGVRRAILRKEPEAAPLRSCGNSPCIYGNRMRIFQRQAARWGVAASGSRSHGRTGGVYLALLAGGR